MERGSISVQTENIFPIIKQYLYSDQEIFLRELISNAVDATTKLNVLSLRGELAGEIGDTTIEILVDKEKNIITIRDKGIGMTEDEVKKYLNQVAFSSASEFLEKYKGEQIIGHFGLGFYSAFMVADKVEVHTQSYQEGAPAVTWRCDGTPEYQVGPYKKGKPRGTDVVLHINNESKEYLEDSKIQELLDKYCKFLPVPIQFGTKQQTIEEAEEEGGEKKTTTVEVANIINDTNPLWKRKPNDLEDAEYIKFYHDLHPFSPDPLFWIHLKIDDPFNLTGVLYFPKLNNSFEIQKNKIQLYSNQVFVTDNVKDIVPEFLMLMHGVIDSPDIPLNVSRSYLQSDSNVKKITGYISRKVADKLAELYKKEKTSYESKWQDLGVIVKYGMITDEKFYEKALKFALVENVKGEFALVEDYIGKVKGIQNDKHNRTILLYTNDKEHHDAQIKACQNRGYDVLVLNQIIDNHFIQQLEHKLGNITFVRVDSETIDNLIQKDDTGESVLNDDQQKKVKEWFEQVVKEKGYVTVKPMSPDDMPVVVTKPEFFRRMKEMQMIQGMTMDGFPENLNVTINANHPIIATKLVEELDETKRMESAKYLYNLALLSQNLLKGGELTDFISKTLNMAGKE